MTPFLAAAPYVTAMTFLAVAAVLTMMGIGARLIKSWSDSRSAAESLKAQFRVGDSTTGTNEISKEALLAAIGRTPMRVLASDRALRQQVYNTLRSAPSPLLSSSAHTRVIGADSTQYIFAAINETLAQTPRVIPEDEDNPPQKASLDALAERLSPMQEPFRSWSKSFRSAAETLATVLPMNKKLDALLQTALKAKAHFDVDFYGAANEIRERAQDQDEAGCTEAINKMVESVVSWVHLTGDWYSLRRDAASRMHRAEDGPNEWSGQLHHIAVKFAEPDTRKPMVWWQTGLLSSSDSLDRLSTWIFREIDDRIRDGRWSRAEFSAVCSMSSTGVPLATMLSSHYGKRLLVIDEGEYRFPPGFQPDAGTTILLVDSNISTGQHLFNCASEIAKRGAFVMGAVVICENDLINEQRLPIVETLRSNDRLIRLFTLRDIYSRWYEEQALAGALHPTI